ncbi:PilZ domain-containing protein [Paenibacillus sp. GCM10023250]|uniref:PilZ domain-containing protein n=1 Tax=Paenibacillus sp. GCM10023250 TaxID=3252648 RepID=UPI003609D7D8
MAGGMKARIQDVYGSGDRARFTLKALLHSRTVVEKDGYVSTGILTHAEGDMMEIELTEFRNFELGDPVNLTVYSPVGIHRLRSSVIAKASGALAVLFPERSLAGLEERRESPRVDVAVQGKLKHRQTETVTGKNDERHTFELEEEFEFVTRNISDSGIGFKLLFGGPKLDIGDVYDVTLALETQFPCRLEIIRKDDSGQREGYGARFLDLSEQQRRGVRAFLIREQVGAYFRLKQQKLNR